MGKLEKIIIKFLRIGVIAVFFVPLIYSSATIFPFIFPKSLAFRFLVELLVVPYLYLILVNPGFRPRKSRILPAIGAFFLVQILATIFSIDPIRSLWGDHERMMGLFMYAHVVLFFLIAVSVYRTKEDWRKFISYAILAGAAVTGIGFIQYFSSSFLHETRGGRIFSTFGNSIYLSAYLLIQMYLLLWYALGEKRMSVRVPCFILLALEFIAFSFARTRGALIALIASICFGSLILAWNKMKSRPRMALGLVSVPLLIIAFLLIVRATPALYNNRLLTPIKHLSLREGTATTRLMNWKVGLRAWAHRPILGWGPENYYYGFNRYYDPKFYEFSAYETWQDHSHNFLIDSLSESGILGLLSFLSIFIFAAAAFIRHGRNKGDHLASVVFLSILVAYFVQNLFAFDTLGIWIMIYAVLGYAHVISAVDREPVQPGKTPLFLRLDPSIRIAGTLGALLLMFVISVLTNVVPFSVSAATISAGANFSQDPKAAYNAIMNALQKPSPYKAEIREELSKIVTSILQNTRGLSYDDASRLLMNVNDELKKDLKSHPNDTHFNISHARWNMIMANVLEPSYYLDAEEALLKAKELSPARQQVYFMLERLYIMKGQNDLAAEAGKQSVDLAPRVPESHWHYGESLARAGRLKEGFLEMRGALHGDFGTPFTNWLQQEMDYYVQTAEQSGQKNEALWWRGILLSSRGEARGSYENMKKAADAGYSDALEEHLPIYFNGAYGANQPVTDVAFLKIMLEKYPYSPSARFELGRILLLDNQRDQAKEMLLPLAKDYPSYRSRVVALIGPLPEIDK